MLYAEEWSVLVGGGGHLCNHRHAMHTLKQTGATTQEAALEATLHSAKRIYLSVMATFHHEPKGRTRAIQQQQQQQQKCGNFILVRHKVKGEKRNELLLL